MTSTPRTNRLKQELATAKSVKTAKRIFDEFIALGVTDAEIELGSVYFSWTLFEMEGG
jgi:hypothetical protein